MNEQILSPILLVEKNSVRCGKHAEMLKNLGYTAIAVQNAEKALEVIQDDEKIKLVLLDIGCGDGKDPSLLYTAIQKQRIHVLFLTRKTERVNFTRMNNFPLHSFITADSSGDEFGERIGRILKTAETEEKLISSEKKTAYISDLISDYIFTLGINADQTFRVDYISDNYYTIAGQSSEDRFQLSNWAKAFYGEDLKKAMDTLQKCITDGKPDELVCRSHMLADQERWIRISLLPEWSESENRVIALWGAVKDITRQKQAENAYILKNTILVALLQASINGIIIVNNKNQKILHNRKFIEMWEINPDTADDGDDEKKIAHMMSMLKESQTFLANQKFLLENPEATSSDELELINGTVLERFSSTVYDDNGNKYGRMWIFHDITKRKQNENKIRSVLAEKEMALKEVHHRMKNNMSTIMGLLTLQADMLSDDNAVQALHEARDRVQSMMILYDKLYRSPDFLEMPVREYLEELIEKITGHFPNKNSVKVETNLENFILTATQLSVIGILLNELLTNAMKHAFAGRETGHISVSVSQTGQRILIVVEDDGNGIPEAVNFDNSQGFGLTLIRMLSAQLNGNLVLDRKNGTKITLDFEV